MSERNVNILLNLKTSGAAAVAADMERTFRAQEVFKTAREAKSVQNVTNPFTGVYKDLNLQQESILKIGAAMRPDLLNRKAEQNILQAKAQEKYNEALIAATNTSKYGEGLGSIVTGLGSLKAAAGPIGIAMAGVGVVVGAYVAGIKAVISLASAASPVTARQWASAWNDLYAVMGRPLVPLLEIAVDQLRLLGDVLVSILPTTQEMRVALQPMRDALRELRPVMADLAPVMRDVGVAVTWLVAVAAKMKANQWRPWLEGLRAATNLLGLGGQGQLSSSLGASGRATSFTGIEELGRSMQLAAFGSGVQDAPTRTATNTDQMVRLLQVIANAAGIQADVRGMRRAILGY